MALTDHLNELLHDHDCVIVPRWGGFLTHYRPARLDEVRRLVHPPGKELSFNRHLTRNDGLLADQLAKREGLGHEAAIARIDTTVAGWREALDREGRLELPHVGLFYRDGERNLQFDPDKRANHLKDAYGLRPVVAIPVQPARTTPVLRALPEHEPAMTGKSHRPHWVAAAGLALLLGTAALWAWRAQLHDGTQWGGMDLFGPGPARTYQPPVSSTSPPVSTASLFSLPDGPLGIRTMPLTVNDSILVTVDLGSAEPLVLKPDSTAVRPPVAAAVAPGGWARFHIVGGCFAQEENAERFLGDLLAKGWPATRLAPSGELHPVAYGSFTRRDEAMEHLARVRSDGAAAAWLLVR